MVGDAEFSTNRVSSFIAVVATITITFEVQVLLLSLLVLVEL